MDEGYRVIGFDIERHVYGDAQYPSQLVLQDVTTIHGSQFASADLIVASPPCQAYSYRAMPWKRAKALPPPDNTLFEACFRIQREAIEAAGRFIPLVVENVVGAQKWVGRARWHYGSFYLWGDVPALMPITRKAIKVPTMGAGWYPPDHPKHVPGLAFNGHADRNLRATKGNGGAWFKDAATADGKYGPGNFRIGVDGERGRRTAVGKGARFTSREDGAKVGGDWFGAYAEQKAAGTISPGRLHGKNSTARKAASAHIAKIPYELARWIGHAWKPHHERQSA